MAPAVRTAPFSPKSVNAFFGDDRNHHQPRHRIGPPPAKQRIQKQPAQQDRRQVRAEVGLPGIGPTSDSGSDPAFGSRQHRHHDHGDCGDDDAGDAPLREA